MNGLEIVASLVLWMSSKVIPYTLDNAEKPPGYDYDVGRRYILYYGI